MTSDMQPRRTLVNLFRQMRYLHSPSAQRALVKAARAVTRQIMYGEPLPPPPPTEPTPEVSDLAQRIMDKCAGSIMTNKMIATRVGVNWRSGHFYEAIRQLKEAGIMQREKKGLYSIKEVAELARLRTAISKTPQDPISHTQANPKASKAVTS